MDILNSKTMDDTELNIENKEHTIKLVCDKKAYIKKQESILAAFYKESFAWSCINIGSWMIAGIMAFIQGIFFMIPYQELPEDMEFGVKFVFIAAVLCVTAVITYVQAYIQYKDNGEVTKLYDKIKYLPVSREALNSFRLKKLFKFIGIVFLVDFILQVGFTAIIVREITLENILYPIVVGFLIPLVAGCGYVLLENGAADD